MPRGLAKTAKEASGKKRDTRGTLIDAKLVCAPPERTHKLSRGRLRVSARLPRLLWRDQTRRYSRKNENSSALSLRAFMWDISVVARDLVRRGMQWQKKQENESCAILDSSRRWATTKCILRSSLRDQGLSPSRQMTDSVLRVTFTSALVKQMPEQKHNPHAGCGLPFWGLVWAFAFFSQALA